MTGVLVKEYVVNFSSHPWVSTERDPLTDRRIRRL